MQLPIDDDEDAKMRLPSFHLGQDLATYIHNLRRVVFGKTEHKDVTVVLGNPSCDLDSFISAFILSYFYNGRPNASKHHKAPIYIPLLNLPFIEKGDLWRLRPEFAVAVRGALQSLTPQSEQTSIKAFGNHQHAKQDEVVEQLITIHELNNNPDTIPSLQHAFKENLNGQDEDEDKDESKHNRLDTILVDHNAPAIETITKSALHKRLHVIGVIDHHVEENYVSKKATPRIIKMGIGSCTTLITNHLRQLNLWTGSGEEQDIEKNPGFQQCARLALTPILVDTSNLTAPDNKMSDLDREEVSFLKALVGSDFDPEDLYQQAFEAKNNALQRMNTQEIFGKDYKQYVEEINDKKYAIGIGSSTKPLSWLTGHAKSKKQFVKDIPKYAKKGPMSLEIFSLLTIKGDQKEVCMFSFGEHGRKTIETFEEKADELDLQRWNEDDELAEMFSEIVGKGCWKVWFMGDTSKSRKQVAPLLRDALKSTGES